MPNTHSTLTSLFTDTAAAIRRKNPSAPPAGEMIADNFPNEIDAIPTGSTPKFFYIDLNGTDYNLCSLTDYSNEEYIWYVNVNAIPTLNPDFDLTNVHRLLYIEGTKNSETYLGEYELVTVAKIREYGGSIGAEDCFGVCTGFEKSIRISEDFDWEADYAYDCFIASSYGGGMWAYTWLKVYYE